MTPRRNGYIPAGHSWPHSRLRMPDLLVYCESTWCNHSATLDADWLPDETPVRSLCPRMVCTRCDLIGAACEAGLASVRTSNLGGLGPRPAASLGKAPTTINVATASRPIQLGNQAELDRL